jgi:LysM repeat protein
MINNYVYGHYGSDGSTVKMRVVRTGYSESPWVSENWVSASSPTGAMRWWMGDYIHRVNILTPRWTEIGIGVGTRGSEMIFVTVFSVGAGGNGTVVEAAPAAPQEAPPPSVRIEQVTVPPEGLDYAVQGGDTLLAIGLRYGLPWERIAEANGLNERSLLQIGQTLRIPGSGAPIAPPIPDVETEEYTVQPNDTLYTIALRRDLYWDEVAAVNGFTENTVLQIGQNIKVPVVEEIEEEEVAPEVVAATTTRRETVGPVEPLRRAGEFTDVSLAAYDVSQPAASMPVQSSTGTGGTTSAGSQVALLQSDGVGATSAVLAAYEAKLQDPALNGDALVAAPAANAAVYDPAVYIVQAGDTVISIAIQHNLEWGALLTLNGMNENSLLQQGQEIRLR